MLNDSKILGGSLTTEEKQAIALKVYNQDLSTLEPGDNRRITPLSYLLHALDVAKLYLSREQEISAAEKAYATKLIMMDDEINSGKNVGLYDYRCLFNIASEHNLGAEKVMSNAAKMLAYYVSGSNLAIYRKEAKELERLLTKTEDRMLAVTECLAFGAFKEATRMSKGLSKEQINTAAGRAAERLHGNADASPILLKIVKDYGLKVEALESLEIAVKDIESMGRLLRIEQAREAARPVNPVSL